MRMHTSNFSFQWRTRFRDTPPTLLENPTNVQNPKETSRRRIGNPTSKPLKTYYAPHTCQNPTPSSKIKTLRGNKKKKTRHTNPSDTEELPTHKLRSPWEPHSPPLYHTDWQNPTETQPKKKIITLPTRGTANLKKNHRWSFPTQEKHKRSPLIVIFLGKTDSETHHPPFLITQHTFNTWRKHPRRKTENTPRESYEEKREPSKNILYHSAHTKTPHHIPN